MYQLAPGQVTKSALTDPPAEFAWSRLVRALLQRRKLLLITFLTAFGLILAYTFLVPLQYTTHVKLIAGSGNNGGAQSDAEAAQGGASTVPLLNALLAATGLQTADTYAELFQEEPVADRVISDLHLNMSAGEFLSHIKVKPITNTSLLDLSVSWPDRAMSAVIANAFANAFIDRERQLIAGQADKAITVLNKQIPDATKQAAAAQSRLSTFQARTNLADVQTQTQTTIAEATALDSKIAAAQVDREQAAASLSNVSAQLGHVGATVGGGSSVSPNPVIAALKGQLAQANVQLQVAEQQYTDEHPSVIALKRQVAELTHEISVTPATVVASANTMPNPVYQQLSQQAATLQSQVASDGAALAQLHTERTRMIPQINALPAEAAQFLELQRQAKLSQDVLTALQQKLNNAAISKATALGDVTITEPAYEGSASVTPSRFLNVIVGFIVSLALAIIIALIVHVFDRRIRSTQQIEEDLDLPVLAAIPHLAALQSNLPSTASPVVALPNGGPPPPPDDDDAWLRAHAVESFLELATSIRYSSSADRRMRCITITSAAQGDGKSTVALNTAMTMAHVEPRVLLIDADLRRPTLHSKMNRELGRGLSDVLVGRVRLDQAILPTEHEGLDLMTSGTRTPNSVKLLQSKRLDETIEELLEKYQMIIIDAPAVAPVVDAAILASKSDGTVMVVSIDNSDSAQVRSAVQKLQSFGAGTLLGTVANRARVNKRLMYDDYFFVAAGADGDQVALPN